MKRRHSSGATRGNASRASAARPSSPSRAQAAAIRGSRRARCRLSQTRGVAVGRDLSAVEDDCLGSFSVAISRDLGAPSSRLRGTARAIGPRSAICNRSGVPPAMPASPRRRCRAISPDQHGLGLIVAACARSGWRAAGASAPTCAEQGDNARRARPPEFRSWASRRSSAACVCSMRERRARVS